MQQISINYWTHNSVKVKTILTKLYNLCKVEYRHSKFQNKSFVLPGVREKLQQQEYKLVYPHLTLGYFLPLKVTKAIFYMSENELLWFLNLGNSHGQFVSNIMKLFYPIMICLFVSHLGTVGGVGCPTIFRLCPWKGMVATMPMVLWYSLNAK